MVMMGEMPSTPPTRAVAVEMRPPIFRYFKVSTTAYSRSFSRRAVSSAASCAAVNPSSRRPGRLRHQKAQRKCNGLRVHHKHIAAAQQVPGNGRRLTGAGHGGGNKNAHRLVAPVQHLLKHIDKGFRIDLRGGWQRFSRPQSLIKPGVGNIYAVPGSTLLQNGRSAEAPAPPV